MFMPEEAAFCYMRREKSGLGRGGYSELGEKLVETAHVALAELVKNAYDADARQVTVRILPDPPRGPEVHVIDDGSGMTYTDVQNYWMRQSPQLIRRTSSFHLATGETERVLGRRLRLLTTAALGDGGFERTELTIEWSKFKPGQEISKITCDGKRSIVADATPGTTLIIDGSAEDECKKRGYDLLKLQLAILAANRGRKRTGFEEDPGFNIHLGLVEQLGPIPDSDTGKQQECHG